MKNYFGILFFLLIAINANADCASSGIYFWPETKTIKQNSMIIITGYAYSQKIITKLDKRYPIYLKSGDKKIKLNVKEIAEGQFSLTQAILVPEKKLEAGLEYTLYVDNLTETGEKIRKWNSETKEFETVKWKVDEGIDTEIPKWVSTPIETSKSYVPFGCGPAIHVNFSFKVSDTTENLLVKTTVTDLKTKKSCSYYLQTENNSSLKIGYGMCSGEFNFSEGENYEVSFDLVDASGNTALWTGDKIKFTKPTSEDWENRKD